ncbi:MAG: chemotaxis response regulator protein-glutamate methylesterase [Thiotrichaceae bacterium]|nr:chemotaxis response regulator protein-glutamate methylesterase [Thiotrichaceae bacterium]
MSRIKVMVVDDSAIIRQVFTKIINSDAQLELVAAVNDPILALKRMKVTMPDVMVLDVEMPKMDGLTFLKLIMNDNPLPVVMCSTLTEKGSKTTMQAIADGAIDFITKPKMGVKGFLEESSAILLDVIKSAARANVGKLKKNALLMKSGEKIEVLLSKNEALLKNSGGSMMHTTDRIVAIGTSTGGTQALELVLSQLPKDAPGMVIVQHMPEKFTAAFAARLDGICQVNVKEAKNGDRVLQGQALIAPGSHHMMLNRSGARYFVDIKEGPTVSRHRPSVDVLFRSTAKIAGKNAVGIIMTGMGADGASGMRDMHDAGAYTIAQDEESSVVYGMPKEAVKAGGVDKIISLGEISRAICSFGTRA